MCVTITDFKGTLNQIVKNWEQWIMQVLQGLEDLEMTGEIGLVNRQEVEMVIGMMDVMKMIGVFTNYLESFTWRFESPNSHTQSYKDITPNACDVWVKKDTHA